MTTPAVDMAALYLNELLNGPKDSATIHYDEDTIPHGVCSDPLHCDCMCPHCWEKKARIVRASVADLTTSRDALQGELDKALKVLAPSMPESGIEDAARQVKQAAISAAGNCDDLEAQVKALEARVETLTQLLGDVRPHCHGGSILIDRIDAALQGAAPPSPLPEGRS